MPRFLEEKLKEEYGANSSTPYKVMNSIGAMKGNKETAKGKEMEKKHIEKKYDKKFKENDFAKRYKHKLASNIK